MMGVSRVSRASLNSPIFSFMQLRFPFSFKTLVQLSRSLLFFKTAHATLSFIPFSGSRGLLSCLNFLLGAVDVAPTASARKTRLPRSTGSSFVHARLWNNIVSFHCTLFDLVIFVFWLVMFFTRSRSTLTLALLERSPRLQRTPEPSVTQNPILFHSNRLSLGHSFQNRARFWVPRYFYHSYFLGKINR